MAPATPIPSILAGIDILEPRVRRASMLALLVVFGPLIALVLHQHGAIATHPWPVWSGFAVLLAIGAVGTRREIEPATFAALHVGGALALFLFAVAAPTAATTISVVVVVPPAFAAIFLPGWVVALSTVAYSVSMPPLLPGQGMAPFAVRSLVTAVLAAATLVLVRSLRSAQQEAVRQANSDAVTGTWSRRYGTELLERDLGALDAGLRTPAVLMIDLDHFKSVNDRFGHAAGDAVLAEAARRIEAALEPSAHVVRWGGEEFVGILRHVPTDRSLELIAEEVRRMIARAPIEVDGSTVHVTVSVGGARATRGLRHPGRLVEAADAALYRAKRRGRNCIVVHAAAPAGLRLAA